MMGKQDNQIQMVILDIHSVLSTDSNFHTLNKKLKNAENSTFLSILSSRGRGNRTPVNGFGDRRTTAVLFPYLWPVSHRQGTL